MENSKKNKIKKWSKVAGITALSVLFCGVITLAIVLNVPQNVSNEPIQEVTTKEIEFGVPMSNAVVTKDFADDRLQYNESLNRWEIHLSVDFSSENDNVLAVSDGVVTAIDSNALDGYIIEISHSDGFSSIYSSLNNVINVNIGDTVSMGQVIGKADATASNESLSGSHLHFTLLKDGVEVDPNNYLDLQNK